MRLLNIHTLELKDFRESQIPPYVIASHRWANDETTYKDVKKRRNTDTEGYKKIKHYCEFLRRTNVKATREMRVLNIERDCQWLWIDTACINKESSADLSECINSMSHYYARAEVCYVHLHDVGPLQDLPNATMDFMKSKWFRRGWTLQELLAPRTVVFVNREWQILGHKCQLNTCDLTCRGFDSCLNAKVSNTTGFPGITLGCAWKPASDLSVVERYMKHRKTERLEDRAYCLLGLLGVNLVPIYGERENAWTRLVDEFEKTTIKHRRRLWYERRGSYQVSIDQPYPSEAVGPPPPLLRQLFIDEQSQIVRGDYEHTSYKKPSHSEPTLVGTGAMSIFSLGSIPSAESDPADRGLPDHWRVERYPTTGSVPGVSVWLADANGAFDMYYGRFHRRTPASGDTGPLANVGSFIGDEQGDLSPVLTIF